MSVEAWKSLFDVLAVVLLGLTFLAGAGVLITGNRINLRQEEKLRKFDADITVAKSDLAKQQERAAKAESSVALAEQHSAEANAKAEGFRLDIAKANEASSRAQASLALAEQHAAEANSKAESFRLDIAKANESAKYAEARAAEANLELARFRAPRSLTPAQEAAIAIKLRAVGPQKVDIIIIGDSPEITNITNQIGSVMQHAGWTPRFVGKAISGPNISGVLVGTHIGVGSNVLQAAEVLLASLSSAGISTTRALPQYNDELPMAIMGTWDNKNVAPIRMYVSAKP